MKHLLLYIFLSANTTILWAQKNEACNFDVLKFLAVKYENIINQKENFRNIIFSYLDETLKEGELSCLKIQNIKQSKSVDDLIYRLESISGLRISNMLEKEENDSLQLLGVGASFIALENILKISITKSTLISLLLSIDGASRMPITSKTDRQIMTQEVSIEDSMESSCIELSEQLKFTCKKYERFIKRNPSDYPDHLHCIDSTEDLSWETFTPRSYAPKSIVKDMLEASQKNDNDLFESRIRLIKNFIDDSLEVTYND
jgi:hypothetical protein